MLRIYLRPVVTRTPKGKAIVLVAKRMLRDLRNGSLVLNKTVVQVPGLGQGIPIGYNMWNGTIRVKGMFKNPDSNIPIDPRIKRDPDTYGVYEIPYEGKA